MTRLVLNVGERNLEVLTMDGSAEFGNVTSQSKVITGQEGSQSRLTEQVGHVTVRYTNYSDGKIGEILLMGNVDYVDIKRI